MRTIPSILKSCVLGLGICSITSAMIPATAQAQFQTAEGHVLEFYLLGTNGAASLYNMTVTINNRNVIAVSGSSRRYDVAATGSNLSSSNGVAITKASTPASRVGTPVITNSYTYNDSGFTNRVTTSTAPFAIFLNDGGRVKGKVVKEVNRQTWSGNTNGTTWTNWTFTGGAAHQGKIGFGGNIFGHSGPLMLVR